MTQLTPAEAWETLFTFSHYYSHHQPWNHKTHTFHSASDSVNWIPDVEIYFTLVAAVRLKAKKSKQTKSRIFQTHFLENISLCDWQPGVLNGFPQAERPQIYTATPAAACYYSLYMTPSEYGDQLYEILAVRCEEQDVCKLAVTMETRCSIDSMTLSVWAGAHFLPACPKNFPISFLPSLLLSLPL